MLHQINSNSLMDKDDFELKKENDNLKKIFYKGSMKKNKSKKNSIPSLFAKKYIYYYYAFFWIILLLFVFSR